MKKFLAISLSVVLPISSAMAMQNNADNMTQTATKDVAQLETFAAKAGTGGAGGTMGGAGMGAGMTAGIAAAAVGVVGVAVAARSISNALSESTSSHAHSH